MNLKHELKKFPFTTLGKGNYKQNNKECRDSHQNTSI